MMMWLILAPGILSGASLFWLLSTGGELRSILVNGIVLCAVLFVAVLYRATRWFAAALTFILPLALVVALQPVCTPLDERTLDGVSTTARDIYMDVYQQSEDGSWKQCRTQLSRWLEK